MNMSNDLNIIAKPFLKNPKIAELLIRIWDKRQTLKKRTNGSTSHSLKSS
jgi:hypothetical protein